MRLRVLTLVALTLFGAANAQTSGYITVGRHTIGQAMRTFTAEEIYSSLKNNNNLQKGVKWGSKVPYIGAAVVAGGVSYLLNKAFEEVKREATGNPDFDNWNTMVEKPITNGWWDEYNNVIRWRLDDRSCVPSSYIQPEARLSANGNGYYNSFSYTDAAGTSRDFTQREFGTTNEAAQQAREAAAKWKEAVQFNYDALTKSACQSKPSFEDWVEGKPEAGIEPHPKAIEILPELLGRHFDNYVGPYTLDEPVPGVKLVPAPTPNQWTDDPATDPNGDLDGDGVSDADEIKRGTNPSDPLSKPKSPYDETLDFDQDGIKDEDDLDDDNDGASDEDEIAAGTNPKDAASKPDSVTQEEQRKEEECKVNGGTWNSETKQCGERDEETPPDNDCGTFPIARLLKYPGSYIKDVFLPCETPKEIFRPLLEAAKTKYPFALVSNLNNMVSASGSAADRSAVLPNKLGPFEFDWSWLSPLIMTIGLLFKGFTTWVAVDIVLSRLTGQLVIK